MSRKLLNYFPQWDSTTSLTTNASVQSPSVFYSLYSLSQFLLYTPEISALVLCNSLAPHLQGWINVEEKAEIRDISFKKVMQFFAEYILDHLVSSHLCVPVLMEDDVNGVSCAEARICDTTWECELRQLMAKLRLSIEYFLLWVQTAYFMLLCLHYSHF